MSLSFVRRDIWVKTAQGPAVAGAQVYVCVDGYVNLTLPPSPLATIYGDPNGISQLTQPLVTDGFGHTYFYASPNTYTVVIAYNGAIQEVLPNQAIGANYVTI